MSRRRVSGIGVRVVNRSGRPFLVLRWIDPVTGKAKEQTTAMTRRREAEREAALLGRELAEHRQTIAPTSWGHCKNRYEKEKLPSLAADTVEHWYTTANWMERFREPACTDDITASYLSELSAFMRQGGLAESSIASYLGQLRAMLGWAVKLKLMGERPKFDMPHRRKRSKLMRGRPITTEEFERMLAKTPEIVGEFAASSWRHLLRGLWLSGLRISESIELYWDRSDKLHIHGLEKRHPMMRIIDELEKGHQDRLLPITPDFVNFLRSTPKYCQNGPIFVPLLKDGSPTRSVETAKKQIGAIGVAATVLVDTKNQKVKYASAHDLRRSFGARWAPRVQPIVLKELMRHESIETTERYYVGQNAERTASAVYDAFATLNGDDFGDMTDERFWKPSEELSEV